MKKIYNSFLMLTLVGSTGLMAQAPTITSAAIPQIGYTYNMASDTALADMPGFIVSAGSASAQTWNYTTEFANIYGESTAFLPKTSGLGNAGFPGASMTAAIDTNWAYFISNSGGLYIDGVYVGTGTSYATIDYTPNQMVLPTPFTYTTPTVNNLVTATFTAVIQGQNATIKHRASRTISADAFGSLTTPTGTYPNTLRRKTYDITSDSAYIFSTVFIGAQYDTSTNYTWLQNSADAQLMSIDQDKTGTVTKAQYLVSFNNSVATITQPTYGLNLYPNPSSDMTYMTYENKISGPVNLHLFDLSGKQVASLVNENQSAGTQKIAINLAALHLPAGLYFLQLKSNNSLQTIKLSVN